MTHNSVACDIPGRVLRVEAPAGQRVEPGDPILLLEAEPAPLTLEAPVSGTVESVFYSEGDVVPEAAVVAVIAG